MSSVADIRFSSVDKIFKSSEEPVRLCNYTDVYNNEYITNDMEFMHASATLAEIERFGLQSGDIIITKDSETPDDIGIPVMIDTSSDDLVCGYHLAMIRPRKEEVDSIFLAKQLNSHRVSRYFGHQSNGLTRYGLPISAVANTPLWLPAPETQRKIGSYFRMIDKAIVRTEAVIAKLKQVRSGLLHDLLTLGLDEHGQLRDPIVHPEQFTVTPLGRMPKKWKIELLGTCLQHNVGFVQTGPFGSQLHANEYTDDGVPVIMPQDIHEGRFVDGDIARIPETRANDLRRHLVKDGDLIFARRGDLSRCATVTLEERGWLCGTGCLLMRFKQISLTPEWFSLIYRHDFGQRQIAAKAVGTTMLNLNTQLLHGLLFAFPNMQEQKDIVHLLSQSDAIVNAEGYQLHKLKSLKSGLTSDLLTGKVRVPEGLT